MDGSVVQAPHPKILKACCKGSSTQPVFSLVVIHRFSKAQDLASMTQIDMFGGLLRRFQC